MTGNINPTDYKIPVPSADYFKDIHTMVLVSYFPRSGSTLLGYLLTAHRNMVVANEPAENKEYLYSGVPTMAVLNHILQVDKMRFEAAKQARSPEEIKIAMTQHKVRRTYSKIDRYMFVPNQWQACCESLHVIGIKNSWKLAASLLKEGVYKEFKKRLVKQKIHHLKFIFTVRNPYDMIATSIVHKAGHPKSPLLSKYRKGEMLKKSVSKYSRRCEEAAKFFTLMEAKDILINKHEDLVADPAAQLSKLCEFLKVPVLPDYLNDCASIVHKNPNKSRHELNWDAELKEKVAEYIEKYHFLAGYSWDT